MSRAPRHGGRLGDSRVLLGAVLVVVLVPLLISAARVLLHHQFAFHEDNALVELRVRDVGAHTPLVGSYQRYGWNQPGPLLFYVLAVPYRVFGSQFAGLQIGSLLLAGASIAGIAVIAWRRGGVRLLLWSSLLVAVLVRGVPFHLLDPWEPRILILPAALLFFLAFDAVSGTDWAAPLSVAVASLLAEAYAVVAPLALSLAAIAVGSVVVRARRGPGRVRSMRALATAGVTLVVLWLPPLIDAVIHHPSNVQRAWDFFRESHAVLGFGDAYRVVALEFGVPAPWMNGSVPRATFTTFVDPGASPAVPIALLALGAGVTLAAWRRSRALVLGVLAVVAVVVSVLAMSRLVGPVYVWIPESTFVIGMVAWLAAGWCTYEALPERIRPRVDRALFILVGATLVVVAVTNTVTAATADAPRDALQVALVKLTNATVDDARAAHGPILLRSRAELNVPIGGSGAGIPTMALVLVRHGVGVVVDRDLANRFGDFRARPEKGVEEFVLVSAPAPTPPGYRVLASIDPLTSAQREERARITAQLQAQLPNATLHQLEEQLHRDPVFRARVKRLEAIPDLPVLAIVARRLPGS